MVWGRSFRFSSLSALSLQVLFFIRVHFCQILMDFEMEVDLSDVAGVAGDGSERDQCDDGSSDVAGDGSKERKTTSGDVDSDVAGDVVFVAGDGSKKPKIRVTSIEFSDVAGDRKKESDGWKGDGWQTRLLKVCARSEMECGPCDGCSHKAAFVWKGPDGFSYCYCCWGRHLKEEDGLNDYFLNESFACF